MNCNLYELVYIVGVGVLSALNNGRGNMKQEFIGFIIKRNQLIILTLLVVIILSGCTGKKKNEELKITIGNTNINYEILEDETSSELFKFAFEEDNTDIEYVNIGDKVYLDFGDSTPDEFTIKDHLLNSEGDLMYTEKEIFDVPVCGENKKYYFVVNKNLASGLSSYYEANKKDFRGFTVVTKNDDTKKVYSFVIKTDGM